MVSLLRCGDSEQSIVAARASVMIYDEGNRRWVPSGSSQGLSKIHIYQHTVNNTFRVVGRKLHDHEVVIHSICLSLQLVVYTVWVKKIPPPAVFWHFFPNGWEFLINFLHTYYMILYTLDDKFFFNYFQLWRSYAILSATTRRIFTFHYNFNFYVCLLSKWRHWWRHAISDMFIDTTKLFIL